MPEWGLMDTVSDFTPVNVSHTSTRLSTRVQYLRRWCMMQRSFALMIGWPLAVDGGSSVVRRPWWGIVYSLRDDLRDRLHANHLNLDALPGGAHAVASAYGRDHARTGRAPGSGASSDC